MGRSRKRRSTPGLLASGHDVGVSVARAQETFSVDELKVFSRVPEDDVARRHLHKLMQVTLWFHYLCTSIYFFFFFFKGVYPFRFYIGAR